MARRVYEAMGETCVSFLCDGCGADVDTDGLCLMCRGFPCKPPATADATGFVKHDAGKPMMSILPWDALETVARVMTQPVVSGKYTADNWRKCTDPERYESAALRHYAAMKMGEEFDPESKEPHAAHFATNALFALAIRLSLK